MNKFLRKHFLIIVSIFSINWIKQYYCHIKNIESFLLCWIFLQLLDIFIKYKFTISFFYYIANFFPNCHIFIKTFFIYYHEMHTEYLLYILISGKNIHTGLISLLSLWPVKYNLHNVFNLYFFPFFLK